MSKGEGVIVTYERSEFRMNSSDLSLHIDVR